MTKGDFPKDISVRVHAGCLKTALRQKWNAWMVGDDHSYTKGGDYENPEMTNFCQWISDALKELDPDLIIRFLPIVPF